MSSTRTLILLLSVALLFSLEACSRSSTAPTKGDGGTERSTAPSSPAPAASDDSKTAKSGSTDVEGLAKQLVPPHSTTLSRTTAGGGVFSSYSSEDPVETVKSFYDRAIAKAGMKVQSTTSVGNTHSWVFTSTDASSIEGTITIEPVSGEKGTNVVVSVSGE